MVSFSELVLVGKRVMLLIRATGLQFESLEYVSQRFISTKHSTQNLTLEAQIDFVTYAMNLLYEKIHFASISFCRQGTARVSSKEIVIKLQNGFYGRIW